MSKMDRLLVVLRLCVELRVPLPSSLVLAGLLDVSGPDYVNSLIRAGREDGRFLVHYDKKRISAIEATDGAWRIAGCRDAEAAPGLPDRLCLRCRAPFTPSHRHRFCCDTCRQANAGEAG